MVQRRTLEDVMLAADVQTIIQSLTGPDKREFSNHIYHLMTNGYHDRYYIIASNFVAMKIYQKFQFVQDFNLGVLLARYRSNWWSGFFARKTLWKFFTLSP